MKTVTLTLVVLLSVILVGCGNQDTQVQSFITASDKLAADIVQKVKANPTASGLDEAQKMLDDKKSEIKSQYDTISKLRQAQVSQDMMKKLTDSTTKNLTSVNGLQIDFAAKTVGDKAFGDKITKLVKDYNSLYGV